jgi:putative endopeptidase
MKNKLIITGALVALTTSAFIYNNVNKGVDVNAIDKKTAPQKDFFQFSNGNWIKNNPIPASEGRWTAFNIVAERNNLLLKQILESAAKAKSVDPESAQSKVGMFYRVAMDTVKLDKQGFRAITDLLNQIEMISNPNQIAEQIAQLHIKGIPAAFGFDVSQDVKNSSIYTTYLAQSGLGLPDKDYYLKADDRSNSIRLAYVGYINEMYTMATGVKDPSIGKTILQFETEMAQNCMSRTERRNMEKQYNPFTPEELFNKYSNIGWAHYFEGIGLNPAKIKQLIVMQPDYFFHLNKSMQNDLQFWKAYLKWKVINASAPYLHSKAVNAHFAFYGTKLTGTKEQKPRWKTVIGHANNMIGELVAQEYVKVAFTPESKKRVNEMVDNLRESFRDRINKLDWMSAATKTKALEKLNSFTRKLGYPDKWTDLSQLKVTEDSYITNYFSSSEFWFKYNLGKLGKPVDKDEWEMLPQTVNAYYNPVNNEIVFPAAIMQPPFFDPKADDAVNYGAIGAVIGHEFSHGFDDQGSKYDAQGNLNDWWTAEDRKLFDERTKVLVDQFNNFEVLDSVFVNGELTLGENIADLAGLTVSYDAYMRSLEGKPKTTIDGYTPEQRFFIGFGQVWRGHARPEFLRQQVVTDPHSPAKFRVLGPLSNMPQFYNAFGVKKGDGMWRDENNRAKIW